MALASNGRISGALEVYDKVRESGSTVGPKALVSLVEHMESAGQLPRLLQILDELTDTFYWIDGCSRVIVYCVRHKDLRSAFDLLKKLKDAFNDDELAGELLFDKVFSQIAEMEPSGLQLGLDLLQMIKKELKIRPSRKCLNCLC
ncbi:Pentatricopeptide repeat-containing protein [Drosera capensis]